MTEGLVLAWTVNDASADVAEPRGVLDAEDLRVILGGEALVPSPDAATGPSP